MKTPCLSIVCPRGNALQVLGEENLPQDPLHPRNNFMTGWVGRFVQVDDTGVDVGLQVTLKRRATSRNRREMASSHQNCWRRAL